jgi:hypothetical protein
MHVSFLIRCWSRENNLGRLKSIGNPKKGAALLQWQVLSLHTIAHCNTVAWQGAKPHGRVRVVAEYQTAYLRNYQIA